MKVQDLINQASERLDAAGITNSKLEAQVLLAHVLGKDRSWVIAHAADEVDAGDFELLLQRRLNQEPLAYILGHREFYGRRFQVSPAVLIPRHETEVIVEHCLEVGSAAKSTLDIGTGSGCIAITLALEMPQSLVTGVDISEKALAVAISNADRLEAEVDWKKSDLVSSVQGQQFDLIVSNPPYIGNHEELPPDVAGFEPDSALYAGDDGLSIYKRLAVETKPVLTTRGTLVLEIGDDMEEPVREVFEQAGWRFANGKRDLDGRMRSLAFRPE